MQFEIVQRLGVSEEFSERFVVGSSFTSLQCYCFHVGSHPGCALAQAFSELFHSYYKSFGLAHHTSPRDAVQPAIFKQPFNIFIGRLETCSSPYLFPQSPSGLCGH